MKTSKRSGPRRGVFLLLGGALLLSPEVLADEPGGAFTCDFGLPPNMPLDGLPTVTERDRMYMAERPGLVHKHLPIRLPTMEGEPIYSGGRYLFENERKARDYKHWVETDYALDSILFLTRSYFLNPLCYAWRVIGVQHMGDIHSTHAFVRTERWRVPDDVQHVNQTGLLKARWPTILAEAQQRNMTGVWLLYNRQERLVSIVYFTNHSSTRDPNVLNTADLQALETATPLGHVFDDQAWPKIFDRSHYVLSIWFPFVAGDQGEPSVWPQSSSLPLPSAGDGLCVVSRGENYFNSPNDCPATCGNAVADTGETTQNCPGDVRL